MKQKSKVTEAKFKCIQIMNTIFHKQMRIQHCCTYCNTLIKSHYVFIRFILKMARMFNSCFFN